MNHPAKRGAVSLWHCFSDGFICVFTCDKTHTIRSCSICFRLNFGLEKDTLMYLTPSSFCSPYKPVGSHITSLTAHSGPIRLIKAVKNWEGFYETSCLKVGYFPQIFNTLLGSFKGWVLPSNHWDGLFRVGPVPFKTRYHWKPIGPLTLLFFVSYSGEISHSLVSCVFANEDSQQSSHDR